MTQGLIVRNAAGAVVLDITDRLTRMVGSVTVQASGSLVDPGLLTGTPFVIVTFVSLVGGAAGTPILGPTCTVSGSTLSWSMPSGNENTRVWRLTYGVY